MLHEAVVRSKVDGIIQDCGIIGSPERMVNTTGPVQGGAGRSEDQHAFSLSLDRTVALLARTLNARASNAVQARRRESHAMGTKLKVGAAVAGLGLILFLFWALNTDFFGRSISRATGGVVATKYQVPSGSIEVLSISFAAHPDGGNGQEHRLPHGGLHSRGPRVPRRLQGVLGFDHEADGRSQAVS